MGKAQKRPPKAQWPEISTEVWQTLDLKPNVRNARLHTPEQIDDIAKSIKRFGFTIPLLIDEDGLVIAGHGRLLAANKLEIAEVPVIIARGWSDAQKRAYALADNRIAENSSWDVNALRVEIFELSKEEDFDAGDLGFDQAALKALADGTFVPAMPTFGNISVTDAQLEAERKRLAKRHHSSGDQDLIDVMCPECAHEFKVDPHDVSK